MEQMSDQQLVEKAKGGDSAAFSALLSRHYSLIFRAAWKWCGVRQDAEDITQNVCLKLATALRQYRGEAAFTSWLYRITLNTASAEATLISRCLYRCIAALPEKLRMAVLLVCAEGLSHAEAGAALHCKEGTVSWRLSEARKQLAVCLEGKV